MLPVPLLTAALLLGNASLQLPDSSAYVYERDAAGNPTQITDPNGSKIVQSFDDRGLLTSRQSTLATGVLGPTLESFTYDGLGRVATATSGTITSRFTWDSLSRLLSEETLGRKVEHHLDDAGNAVELDYPSGLRLVQSFDALDRLEQLGRQTAEEFEPRAAYTFLGADRLHSQALSEQLRGEQTYDAAGRPTNTKVGLSASQYPAFQERQTWSPRGLKTSTARLDANGEGWLLGHDGANRLLEAATPGNDPSRWSFGYDAVDNQTSRQHHERGALDLSVNLPPDSSGRNRPSAVGGVALSWDNNGNLIAKGNLRFAYDVHNRLTRVTNALGTEIARYDYDALGRRVRKTFPGTTTLETTYSGWRELEEYRNGQIAERHTFGLGLDEMVRLELDQDGDGLLEQALVPVYDSAGNMAMLLNPEGRVAGQYSYSPFGDKRKVRVDNVPPQVEQLRLERQPDGALQLKIDLGEEIDGRWINTGITVAPVPTPQAATQQVNSKQALAIEIDQPIQDGRRARRRVIVTATDPPEPGTELDVVLGVEVLADLFQNHLSEPFTLRLTVPEVGAVPEVLLDTANPEVDEVRLSDGHLEVSFTEQPDPAAATAALRIDGAPAEWELLDETYTLRSEQPLAVGAHVVWVESGMPLDLAGKGVTQAFEQSFTVDGVQPIAAIFEAPDPRDVPLETLANRFTFQGRPYDAETGLFYFRNRYYDPELGRFITPDPLGYVDGPSAYSFAGYSPFNNGDPYGLCVGNLPCPEWARRTGRSLGGFFYQVPITVRDIALLPATALRADYRARKQRIDAYLAGGYAALEEERSVQAVHTKEAAKRAIPIYGTILQAGEIAAAYEQGGAFDGGREVFRVIFSLAGDVTLAYGAAQGALAARGAAAAPEVSYASMLEEMQGEVAAARAAERMRRVAAERLADGAQRLPREQRPNTVAILRPTNGRLIIGRNQGGVTNPDVEAALEHIPSNEFGGVSAEVNCIARALNKGIDVRGATIDVVNVRGPESATGIHATPKSPCTVCQQLLDFFEVGR